MVWNAMMYAIIYLNIKYLETQTWNYYYMVQSHAYIGACNQSLI